ncbi:MAG: tetratricopeptide repeat protein, partial [Gammaproteobacteria bacterium]|nr:tetratricopeptide repeat protein [Gammaproteobacteria bacterium]
ELLYLVSPVDSINSPYIHAANRVNFQSLVIENSNRGPVLVNFWSKKAGPCLRQYPLLDKLVHDYKGRLLLINIDADSELKITREIGISSVPTLKLYRNSEIVESRHGYQPEQDLVELVDQYIARDSDQIIALAIEEYGKGNQNNAYDMITQEILKDPDNPRLPLAIGKLLKYERRFQEALTLFDSLPANIIKNSDVTRFKQELDFFAIANEITDLDALLAQSDNVDDDLAAMQQRAAFFIVNQDYEKSFKQLQKIMDKDKYFTDDFARRSMLTLIAWLGVEHPLVKQYKPVLRRYTH